MQFSLPKAGTNTSYRQNNFGIKLPRRRLMAVDAIPMGTDMFRNVSTFCRKGNQMMCTTAFGRCS